MTRTATVLASARDSERVASIQTTKVRSGKPQNHRHEDGAGAVGQPLHGRARRLRLLHHARDLRQNRGFAQRLGAAHHGAVVVERAGQHAPAWFARQRSGFAGQHRFVHAGAAFQDRGIDREALAGQDQHVVAGANFIERHEGFDAVHDAARSHRPQAAQRIERGQGTAFGTAFERLAQQQKAEDQQHRVEVDLATGGRPNGGERRIEEGDAGSEADQRVHVGGSVAQAADRVGEDAVSRPNHENAGYDQQRPAKEVGRQGVEPRENAHQGMIERAHLRAERHGQQHRDRPSHEHG